MLDDRIEPGDPDTVPELPIPADPYAYDFYT
jgi:hypothetical protein